MCNLVEYILPFQENHFVALSPSVNVVATLLHYL